MYISKLNEETDAKKIRDVIRAFSFATVVSFEKGEPVATHVPLHMDQDVDGVEWLYGHFSKANTQWMHFDGNRSVLAIFQGSHHYVSPSWYDHVNVPTWNYVAIHVYGRAVPVTDYQEIRIMFRKMIDTYEKPLGTGYSIDAMPTDYYDRELKGLQAFKIRIDRIEANFKLSQNRHDRDHRHIQDQLKHIGTDDARGVAELMKENRP